MYFGPIFQLNQMFTEEESKVLSRQRIIQKNLVHFQGFPDRLYSKELLCSQEYFGPVLHGLENGRKINFPTLNMEINENLLPNGVYITRTFIDGKIYKSMTNIGTHPSISELSKPIIETNVINFSEFIYGKVVKVEFLKFIREQKKFPSLNELKEQLKKDLIQAQNYN